MWTNKNSLLLILWFIPFMTSAQWTENTLPQGRTEINAQVIGDNIYFIGGALTGVQRYMKMDVLNVPTQTWSTIDVPNGTKGPRSVAIDNKLYIADIEGDRTIYIYDTENTTWSELSVPSFIEELTYLDSMLAVLNSGDLHLYNRMNTQEWERFDFPFNPGATVVATNGKIAIAGGSGNDLVRIYDVATNSWTEANLSIGRRDIRSIGYGSKMFFIGGEADGFNWTDRIDIYDTETDTWSIDSLSRARLRFDITIHNDKLFIAGGQIIGFSGQFRKEVDIYDLTENTWETIEMPTRRRYASVVGHEDKLYIAGGSNDQDNLDIVEVYKFFTSSNEELEKQHIRIFPNPVSDRLLIQSETVFDWIYITDVNGRVVFNTDNLSTDIEGIDVAHLNQGVYFLFTGQRNVPFKFIKG